MIEIGLKFKIERNWEKWAKFEQNLNQNCAKIEPELNQKWPTIILKLHFFCIYFTFSPFLN